MTDDELRRLAELPAIQSLLDRIESAESALADARLLARAANKTNTVFWSPNQLSINGTLYRPIEFHDGLPVLTDEMRGWLRELLGEGK